MPNKKEFKKLEKLYKKNLLQKIVYFFQKRRWKDYE